MRGLLKGAPPAEKSSPTATPIVDLFIIRSLLRVSGREGPETNERTNGVNLHVLMKSKLKHRNKNSRVSRRNTYCLSYTRYMYCTVSPCVFPAPRLDSCFVFFFLRTSGAACWEINFRKTSTSQASTRHQNRAADAAVADQNRAAFGHADQCIAHSPICSS